MQSWPPPNVDWYYADDSSAIACGDCREILPLLPPVDLVLTDPPYGIGSLMKGGRDTGHWNQLSAGNPWDAAAPDLAFLFEQSTQMVIWGGNYFPLPPSRCWLAWLKTNSVRTQADMELAWTNRDAPARSFPWPTGGSYFREHPTEKPLALMRWSIGQCEKNPDVILDPFMGSGTTLRAAKDLGLRAIGIEINPDYCAIARDRLRQEVFAFEGAL